ncbi:MAG: glycerophosphodiester phosphodiesterase [Candidatus Marinimicrobia bacterium]|jgi:glycerophosphoryl diester phosphodiesterase|nr:glycerophosphodiester phosphodiesterase [Candidatus Neomarinimicrobiota bacterium]MBT3943905.1 glycerophosphodiester phosphodiesterase [Candidatus Neomarinimicrobiota bacterium]MBT4111899.1 glycerophosphodiester phosphodiesterase [Candidatus Neomarinimicrobiota bacterium]MBT4316812.1 glycerophosphodiester phosphodiesterase [Candidatus Neomarinimicrobiota bacterium]MBT4706397.1 glycerophosphodiester phosphodiesterase [Candidatus Neomarinimicrobiota bacterium]
MLIIGHRGARGYIAENTLESIQKALDLNVDGVEIDVYQCASGEIVVFHDSNLNRLTGNKGFIEKTNFDELNTILVKGNYKIPTLGQVLELIAGSVLLNIELKGKNTAILTAAILKKYLQNSQSDIKNYIVSSDNWNELTLFKNQNTGIPIGVLSHTSLLLQKELNDIIEKGKELNAVAIHPKFSLLSKRAIDRMHSSGFLVYSWTINRPKDVKRAIQLGVDGIITDFPDRIIR